MSIINKFIRSSQIEELLGLDRNVVWSHINILLGKNIATNNEFIGTYQDYFVTEAGLSMLADEATITKNKDVLLDLVELFYEKQEIEEADTAERLEEEELSVTCIEEGISFVKREDNFLTSTRGIAERFGKRHSDVLRSITNLLNSDSAQNCVQFFEEVFYKDGSGKQNKEYLVGKDGFTLLVMGFTGAVALDWKIKYIRAFNKMEEYVRTEMVVINELPPITRAILQLEQNQMIIQQQIEHTNNKIKALNTTLSISGDTAKEDICKTINQLVKLSGRTHQEFRRETYMLLESQEHVKLETRLLNAKKRALHTGHSSSQANSIKKIDLICNDKRLLNAYKNILTQMTVNYDLAQ